MSVDPFLEIDYESLVNNTERECRKIINYIGLEWDDRCLEFYKNDRIVKTASNWQVRQPIYKESLHRWKHYETFLEPLKRALGQK